MTEYLEVVRKYIHPDDGLTGAFPGAVLFAKAEQNVIADFAEGYANRYSSISGEQLPKDQWEPMTKDKIFDSEY